MSETYQDRFITIFIQEITEGFVKGKRKYLHPDMKATK